MERQPTRLLVLAVFALVACAASAAPRSVWSPVEMPEDAWATLQATPGIQFGGKAGLAANVQVVCDAHCPYCARLYVALRDDRPELRVRWVPVAYFKPDSDSVAAAILASPNQQQALDENYRRYDHTERRGGYQTSTRQRIALAAPHSELKRQWSVWGGFTPMVIVRTEKGTVVKAVGSTDAFLDPVLDQAASSAKEYRPW